MFFLRTLLRNVIAGRMPALPADADQEFRLAQAAFSWQRMDTTMTRRKRHLNAAGLFLLICAVSLEAQQEFLPSPPATDHSLIYVLDQQNKLIALPFETAVTPLKPDQVAKSTTTSYIQLKGEHSATVLAPTQRIFLFTIDRGGAHPPLLVWLTPHHGARRVTAIAQRGMAGFAISSAEIVRPVPRGLTKNGDEVFMELRPRVSLMPGEYAIIGNDLTRVATFRVISAAN
jgi:hypothetical protein